LYGLLWVKSAEKQRFQVQKVHKIHPDRCDVKSPENRAFFMPGTSYFERFPGEKIFSKISKKHLQFTERYGIIMERDCTRYAMKREVAAGRPVFPWSMSDFKPGEVIYTMHRRVLRFCGTRAS
jgi:hypothetical protein